MTKVKIFGAGSIGNHLAYACRNMGWQVVICDLDRNALERTKNDIYPMRYGSWDDEIKLFLVDEAPKEDYDLIIVGTPPNTHMSITHKILETEKTKYILIEKPVCTPSLDKAQLVYDLANEKGVKLLVGFNHVLGKNTVEAERLLSKELFGKIISIDAGIREHWGGIFGAHPWLSGPQDSYLGFTNKGGGAVGEHSHGINIWQHFANYLGFGKIIEVTASMDYVKDGVVDYDRIVDISVKTEKNYYGHIVQDVVTQPSKKYVKIQGENGYIEWRINYDKEGDAVISYNEGKEDLIKIPKKRPDDFKMEIEHIDKLLNGEIEYVASPINIERGFETMLVIAAACESHRLKRAVKIDYSKGYVLDAIIPF